MGLLDRDYMRDPASAGSRENKRERLNIVADPGAPWTRKIKFFLWRWWRRLVRRG